MVSKTAILHGLETKWDNDTVNGIINGYYLLMVQKSPII